MSESIRDVGVNASAATSENCVRICRPAFQDFQRLLHRLGARAELRRQVMKLRYWQQEESQVLDARREPISDTDIGLLLIDGEGNGVGLQVAFFDFRPPNVEDHAIWVLALLRQDESITPITKSILLGRRAVVLERAPSFEI